MSNEALELERILNQEMEAYLKLEEYIDEKNDHLIKNDIEKVKEVDIELEKYNTVVQKLEGKRREICSDNTTLKEIIQRIENREQADKLANLRETIKGVLLNVQKKANINTELLKHSLKVAESSIVMIANTIAPEGAAYNRKGATKVTTGVLNISSVEHEA